MRIWVAGLGFACRRTHVSIDATGCGRAGRSENRAAYLQTYQPEHPVIRAILGGEEEAFWNAEAAERQAAQVPHLDVWPQSS